MLARIAAIQMNSSSKIENNLVKVEKLISEAANKQAKIVVLPEMFAIMGKNAQDKLTYKELFGAGAIQNFLLAQAKKYKVWLIAGTIPIASLSRDKIRAACLVINEQGNIVARYDKIHLFDVVVGEKVYQESLTVEAGNEPVVVDTPIGKIGLAVCYDIRFPEFCGKLMRQGAEIIAVPAAFTQETGKAHWELLTRARAVENWCYVVGAGQTGTHDDGRTTFGHSLIVEPWGNIVACLPLAEGTVVADIDLKYLETCRNKIPSLNLRTEL